MAAPTYSSGSPLVTVSNALVTANATVDTSFQGISRSDTFNLLSLPALKLTPGTAAGQINAITKEYRGTLTATTLDLDLTALVDDFGNVVNFSKIKGLLVASFATTDGFNLNIGGAASNALAALFAGTATSKITLGPGYLTTGGVVVPSYFLITFPNTSGLATSGTSKIIRLDSGANTIPYLFFAFGIGV